MRAADETDEKKSVGLDPRAFAFDPSNPASVHEPAARARDAPSTATAERSGGSLLSNDGPQGSTVSAAVSGKKRRDDGVGVERGGVDAHNADAAGSDVEDAGAAVKRTRRG